MIGLDTNVLLRYIVGDDPKWTSVVRAYVDRELSPERPGYINSITLAELVWTLRRSQKYDRARLSEVIEGLLSSDSLVLADAAEVERALVAFKAGGAGFADYLIAELNASAGASPTVTIDDKASRREPFTPIT